jgi:hypothetical protein
MQQTKENHLIPTPPLHFFLAVLRAEVVHFKSINETRAYLYIINDAFAAFAVLFGYSLLSCLVFYLIFFL